jgi:hypothetical protein
MAQARAKTFTVEGGWPFPVDMLRYDVCYPATEQDSVEMATACDHRALKMSSRPIRRVTLNTLGINRPTVGRWESFGWKVVS